MDVEEYKQRQWELRLTKSRIPKRFWGLSFDKLDDVPEVVLQYVDNMEQEREAGRGLILVGKPGTGKTATACTLGLTAFKRGYSAAYVTLAGYKTMLLDEMRLSTLIGKLGRDEVEEIAEEWDRLRLTLERYRTKVVFLILDDVGKEHHTDSTFIESSFDQLLRDRYDAGLPTVITSNKPLAAWVGTYSDSMRSFLDEACVQVPFSGEDRRKKQRKR